MFIAYTPIKFPNGAAGHITNLAKCRFDTPPLDKGTPIKIVVKVLNVNYLYLGSKRIRWIYHSVNNALLKQHYGNIKPVNKGSRSNLNRHWRSMSFEYLCFLHLLETNDIIRVKISQEFSFLYLCLLVQNNSHAI
jgi:hypothetical protein